MILMGVCFAAARCVQSCPTPEVAQALMTLLVSNCLTYNDPATQFYAWGQALDVVSSQMLSELFPERGPFRPSAVSSAAFPDADTARAVLHPPPSAPPTPSSGPMATPKRGGAGGAGGGPGGVGRKKGVHPKRGMKA
jgi:hypothetical protein